jgi:hypothetical protein
MSSALPNLSTGNSVERSINDGVPIFKIGRIAMLASTD